MNELEPFMCCIGKKSNYNVFCKINSLLEGRSGFFSRSSFTFTAKNTYMKRTNKKQKQHTSVWISFQKTKLR